MTVELVDHAAVIGEVLRLHLNKQDFSEGDLCHRLDRFDRYVPMSISISELDINEWYIDEDKVSQYVDAYRATGTYPRIVFDSIDRSIIDGIHRVAALIQCGLTEIDAYVGTESNADPTWTRDMYDDFDGSADNVPF